MADNIFMAPQVAPAQLKLNICDIININERDRGESEMADYTEGGASEANFSQTSSFFSRNDPDFENKKKAYVKIIEQPQPKALRFRYICEGRSAGSIPGVSSTAQNKTFPTIKIMNYKGPAVVVVSCVTHEWPYRAHPHNLVGKEGCNKGVCTVTIDNESMEYTFSNLGIQCVKKKDVDEALKLREEIRVDPFGHGFSHRSQPQSIDLNAVRLCFQVFLNSGKDGSFNYPLKPVVSQIIYDKKATSDLNICKLSDCSGCVTGGKEIILLCDKVTKEDIQVRFFEVVDGQVKWQALGDFQASDVHRQYAIAFKTPRYADINIDHSVKVYIQLQRPSDGSTSEPLQFEYYPMDADPFYKRRKIGNGIISPGTEYADKLYFEIQQRQASDGLMEGQSSAPRSVKVALRGARLYDNVKVEPPDSMSLSTSPDPLGVRTVTMKPVISPQHNGGGLMYENRSPLPLPTIQTHLQPTVYYTTPSPGAHGQIIDVSFHSPQSNYYQISPLSVDLSQAEFSPENPAGASAYPASPLDLLTNPPPSVPTPVPPLNLVNDLPYTELKPSVDTNLPWKDLGNISSSDLNNSAFPDLNNMANLSDSFNLSLNLTDGPLNQLDRKTTEESKQSLNTPFNSENISLKRD